MHHKSAHCIIIKTPNVFEAPEQLRPLSVVLTSAVKMQSDDFLTLNEISLLRREIRLLQKSLFFHFRSFRISITESNTSSPVSQGVQCSSG